MLGRIVPELNDPAIREIVVRPYRVIYWINDAEQRIDIVRFWHAVRGLPMLE